MVIQVIKANCRDKFNADDFAFIVNSLARDAKNKVALTELLTDTESRDEILDQSTLFQDVVQESGVSKISPYLYFYILTRKAFLETDIDDREMTDYIACMLAEFCSAKRAQTISPNHSKPYHYLVDIMTDFVEASSFEAFFLRSHLGNYALFMTGFFPDAIYRKSTYGRKAPGFEYYEKMGKSSYQWASQHRLAIQYSLVEVLATLAERFRHVRIALNNLVDNYLVIQTGQDSMDKMLRQLFFGNQNNNSQDLT